MKVVINKCYGGFGLSPLAIKEYLALNGKECFFYKKDIYSEEINRVDIENADYHCTVSTQDLGETISSESVIYEKKIDFSSYLINRTDLNLVKVVESLGAEKANGAFAKLKIVEIPDDVEWYIDEYDGVESIHERHDIWY